MLRYPALRLVQLLAFLAVQPLCRGFTPKDSAHCLRWVTDPRLAVRLNIEAQGKQLEGAAPPLCRRRRVAGRNASGGVGGAGRSGVREGHLEVGIVSGNGACRIWGSEDHQGGIKVVVGAREEETAGSAGGDQSVPHPRDQFYKGMGIEQGVPPVVGVPATDGGEAQAHGGYPSASDSHVTSETDSTNTSFVIEYAAVNEDCLVWWRWLPPDQIPPMPELAMILGESTEGVKLSLCRVSSDAGDADRAFRDNASAVAGTIPAEGDDYGMCFYATPRGTASSLNAGGGFHVLQARPVASAAGVAPCASYDTARRAEIAASLRDRVDRFLDDEDASVIEEVVRQADTAVPRTPKSTKPETPLPGMKERRAKGKYAKREGAFAVKVMRMAEAAAEAIRGGWHYVVGALRSPPEGLERLEGEDFSFRALLDVVVGEFSACELEEVLSPARFYPHPLNTWGLHLLRCLLAERMREARVRTLGYDRMPDYAAWRRDGILMKDMDDPMLGGDEGIIQLLRMAGGEENLAIPSAPLRWIPRNVSFDGTGPDEQTKMHMDTFQPIVKVWAFDSLPEITLAHGPLHYARGTHRNTKGKLAWMHMYAQPPASEALLEPSFRLLGSPSAAKASPEFVEWAQGQTIPALPIPGARRTLVIADTSGLHHRGIGVVGAVRQSWRLRGDNDGGLRRLDPFRWPRHGSRDSGGGRSHGSGVRDGGVKGRNNPQAHVAEQPGRIVELQLAGCNTDCGRVEIKLSRRRRNHALSTAMPVGSAASASSAAASTVATAGKTLPLDTQPQWGYVCAKNWTLREATVVCRQLGFHAAFGADPSFGGGEDATAAAVDIACEGNETSLEDCRVDFTGRGGGAARATCGPTEAVGVACIARGIDAGMAEQSDPVSHKRKADIAAGAPATVGKWHRRRDASCTRAEAAWFAPTDHLNDTADPVETTRTAISNDSGGVTDCSILPGVPLPFSDHLVREVYIFADRLLDTFRDMDRQLRQRLCAPTTGNRIQHRLVDLVRRGLRTQHSIGMDLSAIAEPPMDPDEIALVRELYFAHDPNGEMHWELGQSQRTVPSIRYHQPRRGGDSAGETSCAAGESVERGGAEGSDGVCAEEGASAGNVGGNVVESEADRDTPNSASRSTNTEWFSEGELAMLGELERDGIALVDDWGLAESALRSLERTAASLVDDNDAPPLATATARMDHLASPPTVPVGSAVSSVSGGAVITARTPLPQMEALLRNATLNKVVMAYLGNEVMLEGHKITKLSTRHAGDDKQYVAARWHHDRTGRRLKLFVFLHDIDCANGHPTRVVAGTNNLVYFRTESMPASRFRDEYVGDPSNGLTERLGCGKRGGGFLVDTHTIHKGTAEGNETRTTIIAEYHNALKCPAVRALKLQLPCPSGDQFMVQRLIRGAAGAPPL